MFDVSFGRVISCTPIGDGLYEALIDLTPQQQRTPMKVHHIRKTRTGVYWAVVNSSDIQKGTPQGWSFDSWAGKNDAPPGGVDDTPENASDPAIVDYAGKAHYAWLPLESALGFEVQFARVLDGEVYLVIRSGDVPRGVPRSSIYGEVLKDFLDVISPASIDHMKRGPSPFANDLCWVRLRDLPGQGDKALDVAKAESDRIDGLTREECFERYQKAMQHENLREDGSGHRGARLNLLAGKLNPAQIAVAREEWSTRLRAKTKASEDERRERDRNQVQLDIDPEDL